jgi:phosphoglucosamine mutase
MSARRYFGTDGIRGRVGEHPISADFMLRLGAAAGRVLVGEGSDHATVVIGKDTRISGYMFEAALEAGLVAAGADVRMLGPMPTPAVAYLTRSLRADAGIVISASHNPHYDNGIKFFSAQGEKLGDDIEAAIEAELEKPFSTQPSERLGKAQRVNDAMARYAEFCKSTVPDDFVLSGLKLVLDCAHGATYQVAPRVFSELGAVVDTVGTEPDGLNINDGVGSTHPESLIARVRETGADLGIAFDGDGDRVMMVDGAGTLGDAIVSALQVLEVLRRSGRSLEQALAGYRPLPQQTVNVRVAPGVKPLENAAVQAAQAEAEAALAGRGRLVLRPSGTEPVVRVTVEADDDGLMRQVLERLADVVRAAA